MTERQVFGGVIALCVQLLSCSNFYAISAWQFEVSHGPECPCPRTDLLEDSNHDHCQHYNGISVKIVGCYSAILLRSEGGAAAGAHRCSAHTELNSLTYHCHQHLRYLPPLKPCAEGSHVAGALHLCSAINKPHSRNERLDAAAVLDANT